MPATKKGSKKTTSQSPSISMERYMQAETRVMADSEADQHTNTLGSPGTSDESSFQSTVLQSLEDIKHSNIAVEKRLGKLEDISTRSQAELSELTASITYMSASIETLQSSDADKNRKLNRMENELTEVRSENNSLKEAINKLERFSRRNNIRLYNFPETRGETSMDVTMAASNLLREKFPSCAQENDLIERAHRIGVHAANRTRPVIIKLRRWPVKREVLATWRKALQEMELRFGDDLTEQDYQTKQKFKAIMQEAYNQGRRPRFQDGRLYIDGKLYRGPLSCMPGSEKNLQQAENSSENFQPAI